MSYKIFCILPGGHPAFAVNIKQTETVSNLKDAIRVNTEPELDGIDADSLSLYHINVGALDMEKAIVEVEGIFQGLSTSENIEWLNPIKTLESIFEASGPPLDKIHILVLVPGGESMDPRMWRCY